MLMQDNSEHEGYAKGKFLTSRAGLVMLGFLVIVGVLLFTEHRAHIFGILVWLPLLACLLMHFFMHPAHSRISGLPFTHSIALETGCDHASIAPSICHAHVVQRADASNRTARAQRDAGLKIEVQRVFKENFGGLGARGTSGQTAETGRFRGRLLRRGATDGKPWPNSSIFIPIMTRHFYVTQNFRIEKRTAS